MQASTFSSKLAPAGRGCGMASRNASTAKQNNLLKKHCEDLLSGNTINFIFNVSLEIMYNSSGVISVVNFDLDGHTCHDKQHPPV